MAKGEEDHERVPACGPIGLAASISRSTSAVVRCSRVVAGVRAAGGLFDLQLLASCGEWVNSPLASLLPFGDCSELRFFYERPRAARLPKKPSTRPSLNDLPRFGD